MPVSQPLATGMTSDPENRSDLLAVRARRARAAWIARHILPLEPGARAWLRRRLVPAQDIEDVIHDAYARLAALDSFDGVTQPQRFFFTILRNLLTDHIRRSKVVRIETMGAIDELPQLADHLTPERIAGDRADLALLLAVVETLPARCREIFRMRKMEGLPQRVIAQKLNISEGVVEHEGARGLAMVLQALGRVPARRGGKGRP